MATVEDMERTDNLPYSSGTSKRVPSRNVLRVDHPRTDTQIQTYTRALIKAMAIRRIDLQGNMPTGRARGAAERRATNGTPTSPSLRSALSQPTRHHLFWQGVICVEASRPPTEPEAAEALSRPTSHRRARGDDGDTDTGESRHNRRRTTTSAAPPGSSTTEDAEPNVLGTDDTASLAETILSVCSKVELFYWMLVPVAQGTRSTYVCTHTHI